MFQSTHPHGVRLTIEARRTLNNRFNPRTHTGCDLDSYKIVLVWRVSIHAPTRGATSCKRAVDLSLSVSIHAPTRGATRNWAVYHLVPYCFNPRTHTGCDTKGYSNYLASGMFQSTHPHGVRQGGQSLCIAGKRFQSTHPHGVRLPLRLIPRLLSACFNPRTHTGCDTSAAPAPAKQD